MRVVAGSARGRKLKEPSGLTIRPTNGRVKEAAFDIVQFQIDGSRVLDLFAGTGQIGIEALSRGAAGVVFVDSSRDAVNLIRKNLGLCGFTDRAVVFPEDALRFLEKDGQYDFIYIDPPYDTTLAVDALMKIIKFDMLKSDGIIMCEIKADFILPSVPPPYGLRREYRYGSVKIALYGRGASVSGNQILGRGHEV